MQINLSPKLLNDLKEFRQQALRCVNDATFALNNLIDTVYTVICKILVQSVTGEE